jgi:hypothetical protein
MKTKTIKFNDFMDGSYKEKKKVNIDKKQIMALGTALLPLAAVSQMPVFASSDVLVPVTPEAIPVVGMESVGKEIIDIVATMFDPLIDLLVAISFPVASVMILWKVFMGFFRDSDQVWEGVGKVATFYILIQMSPIFMKILKQLGTLAVGI